MKTKLLYPVTLFLLILIYASCKKITNGSSIKTSDSSTVDCKARSYIPLCVGTRYTYLDSGSVHVSQTSDSVISDYWTINYTARKDTMIDGKIFQHLIINGDSNAYFNCDNGVTTSINYIPAVEYSYIGTSKIPKDTVVVKVRLTPLKALDEVGDKWADTVYNGQGFDYYYYSIIEKGSTKNILGTTYSDVIHVNVLHYVIYFQNGPNSNNYLGYTDYYYANGIGLIQITPTVIDLIGRTYVIPSTLLESYSIPN